MACAICHIRKPRRSCPGVHGDICTLCCGNEREVTVDCPFDCPFLQEARKHERHELINPDDFPNQDVRVSEEFLEDHENLLVAAGHALFGAALDTPGAMDSDVRDALDALIRTRRTLQSGVYYETQPVNALAAQISRATNEGIEEFRKLETEKLGMSRTRDSDVLAILVFLQRLALDHNNGRPRCRAFIDYLRSFFSDLLDDEQPSPSTSSLIVP